MMLVQGNNLFCWNVLVFTKIGESECAEGQHGEVWQLKHLFGTQEP